MNQDTARARLCALANLEDRRALELGVPFELRAWGSKVRECLARERELSTLVPGTRMKSAVTGPVFLLSTGRGCVEAVQLRGRATITVAAAGLVADSQCPGCARLWPQVSRRLEPWRLVAFMADDGCWHTSLPLTPAEELEFSCLG